MNIQQATARIVDSGLVTCHNGDTIRQDKDGMPSLAEIVATLRVARGWDKTELAKKAGISRSYVSHIEKDIVKKPSGQVLAGLADALSVPVQDLVAATQGETRPARPRGSVNEDRLLDNFRNMTEEDREELLEIAERKAAKRRRKG